MAKGKHSRKHHRKQHGGLAPDSAWGSVLNNYGDGWTQFMNSLTLSNNQNVASANSNGIVPIGRPNANDPSSSMLKGGSGKKGKKGGVEIVKTKSKPVKAVKVVKKLEKHSDKGFFDKIVNSLSDK